MTDVVTRKPFKTIYDADARKMESRRVRERYTNRIPVICERVGADMAMPNLDKIKYLVPTDLTMGQFCYVVRKRIKLAPEKAIFLMVDRKLVQTSAIMSQIDQEHKDEDGFLYVHYSGENTFG